MYTVALMGLLLAASVLAGVSSPAPQAIYKVQVLRISAQPYRPVGFRVAVDGSVGDEILVGFKVWDGARRGVYSTPGSAIVDYTQPYEATAVSLYWSKRGYDGNPVPTGIYEVRAYARDATSNGRGVWSPLASLRLGA